jgi:hypothetical protein
VRLAARGLRDLDRGSEEIRDASERAAVRAQSRRITRRSLVAAALATGAYLLASG